MKYLVLIYANPLSRAAWEGFTDAERAEGLAAYAALDAELDATGERIASDRLSDPGLTTQVFVREGQITTTDGPLAEAKEFLAGFYLLDCESHERAVEIAGQIPEAHVLPVEVRPVMGLHGTEM